MKTHLDNLSAEPLLRQDHRKAKLRSSWDMNFVIELERNIQGPDSYSNYVYYTSVFGLVGMELTLFITACIVLGFGFVC